ncbi:MAG TPA: c-type cytochrome [Usitatibacter sp.]|nr:c-type cytochrome [Usitatibacter sp.]
MRQTGRLWLAALAAAIPLAAQSAPKEGKQVYDSTCVRCHGSGAEGAPRVGDTRAWSKLSARGLSSLGKSALEGVRKMPPHGGSAELSDVELKRAIVYMVNSSGGHWTEPTDRAQPPAPRNGRQIVQAQCSKCHADGRDGAPRIGDREAWIDRAKLGFDGLVRSAVNGHGAMPARGGMANLTDAEMRSAVTYMLQTSVKQEPKAK